jgi:hypothetical protein
MGPCLSSIIGPMTILYTHAHALYKHRFNSVNNGKDGHSCGSMGVRGSCYYYHFTYLITLDAPSDGSEFEDRVNTITNST